MLSGFIVNFEYISHLVLMFLLSTLNMQLRARFMCVMVFEALFKEFKSRLPREMRYGDDLAIIAEILEKLEEKYLACKNNIECKCLKVNIEKTKIMSGTDEGPVFVCGKYLCGVCRKGVGVNSVYCSFYSH